MAESAPNRKDTPGCPVQGIVDGTVSAAAGLCTNGRERSAAGAGRGDDVENPRNFI